MRFLFVDRILELVPGEWVRGVKHVTCDDAYLVQDEEGRLCLASSLIGETLGQLAAWNVMAMNQFTARPVAGVVASARPLKPAYVGDTLLLESFIERLDESSVQYHSKASVNGEVIFTVEGALGPLLPMDLFISEGEVRAQFAEINRPGEWQPSEANPCAVPARSVTPTACMGFDRILSSVPGVECVAEKLISRSASYFPDHFPRKPVLPMTVLLECKLNLSREFLAQADFPVTYRVVELRKIKMSDFVQPGDRLLCYLKVKYRDEQQLILSYRSEVDGRRVCVLEVVMTTEGN
ncbi:(3R)-hydroxymyristoyl-ACP dehydratase [Legionella rubrilucens]|uniref:(3R)-hydroxymyristoyl-ACP dehydratase n=1 Tax=Legionella rubrilucens TaxID=458 RepID=A0A0W0XMB8_9GAMM|nr:hydroxymyristoyl-ACP dehydratase [Legionella rubrilucens]KTD45678.1 (3R)-hydroxymyristoyl-ACP dehydratase [Legionella rubrilucens]